MSARAPAGPTPVTPVRPRAAVQPSAWDPVPAGSDLDADQRATLPLLTLIARGAVDEDYAVAARRRAATVGADGAAGRTRLGPRLGRHWLAGVGVLAFGVLVAVAGVQTSRESSVDSAGRAALVQRIQQRRATLADQQDQLHELSRQSTDLVARDHRLQGTLSGVQAALAAQRRATGFAAIGGPGLQVRVEDNPDGDADGRVRASDLRLLVNALWEDGAQGVAIDGRRLTTLSSVVNAAIAVQVDRAPVSPPYEVTAVGPSAALSRCLTDTATGQQFAALGEQFGFVVEPRPVGHLDLPAVPAGQLPLRAARPVTATSGGADGGSVR